MSAERWQRLSAALDTLLDLEAGQRDAELARIAQGDSAFATELRELLDAAMRTEGLLEDGAVKLAPDALAALAEPATEPDVVGRRIGHWQVRARIGHGGMGEVLLAERDDAGFVQQAALKRLKRGMDSDELLRRFAQERRILASLEHPLISRLLDGGVDDRGQPYFAMEFIDGAPITKYAATHALGLRERVALMQRVCEVVAYAQERLVVHRDLKPSNVMVDARGEPRLLDFGIAKLLNAEPGTETELGVRAMSPAYAAPEQILGEAISTATDVYALGVLLYELLTGGLPHRRSGIAAEGLAHAVTQEVVEPPSRTLRRAADGQVERAWGTRAGERTRHARLIDGDLDRIVLTALRREPARRYASAAALAGELRLYLEGRPIAARGDSAGYRLRKWVQRNKAGAIATALVVISVLGGLALALWQADVARESAADAQLQRERAQAQAQRAEQVKEFVVSLFRTGNPELAQGNGEMSAADLLREAAARIDKELVATPEPQAELRVAIGQGLVALGARDEAMALMEASIAQERSFAQPDNRVLGVALHHTAMLYEQGGRLDEAERAANEALARLEMAGPESVLPRIAVRTTIAKLATFRGDLVAAEAQYRSILAERRAVVGENDPQLAVDWNNLGAVVLRHDRYVDAEHAFAEASRLLALDPKAPESRQAWLRLGRGMALMGIGDFAAARTEMAAAQEVAERTLQAEHPIRGGIAMGQARLARYDGRTDDAIASATRALELYRKLGHPDRARAGTELGQALSLAQRDDEARGVLAEAVQAFEGSASHEPEYRLAQAALALLLPDGGVAAIDAALAALQAEGYERHNAYAETLGLRARAAAQADDAPGAATWGQRERDALVALLGPDHPRVRAARK